MNFKWDKKYLYWGVTAFLVIAAAIVFFLGLSQIKEILDSIFSFLSILTPVLYGFVIAYILCPIATFIEKPCLRRLFYTIQDKKREKFEREHPGEEPPPKTFPVRKVARVMSVAITMILALLILTGIIWVLLPQLIDTITMLVNNMPTYVTQISDWVSQTLRNYPEVEAYVLQFTRHFRYAQQLAVNRASPSDEQYMESDFVQRHEHNQRVHEPPARLRYRHLLPQQ